jgi:hypothetical protein
MTHASGPGSLWECRLAPAGSPTLDSLAARLGRRGPGTVRLVGRTTASPSAKRLAFRPVPRQYGSVWRRGRDFWLAWMGSAECFASRMGRGLGPQRSSKIATFAAAIFAFRRRHWPAVPSNPPLQGVSSVGYRRDSHAGRRVQERSRLLQRRPVTFSTNITTIRHPTSEEAKVLARSHPPPLHRGAAELRISATGPSQAHPGSPLQLAIATLHRFWSLVSGANTTLKATEQWK